MSYVPGFENDVYVSYARADDDPDPFGQHFVSNLVHDLGIVLAQRLGVKPKIFYSAQHIRPNDDFHETLDHAERTSAIFLAVLSPSYVMRPYTLRELSIFNELAPDGRRIVAVEAYPWEKTDSSPQFQNFRRTLFWRSDVDREIEMRISPATDRQLYYERLHTTADRVATALREMQAAATTKSPAGGGAVDKKVVSFREAGTFPPKTVPSCFFVCFCKLDSQAAADIVTEVEDAGLKCWISSRDVGIGENYQDKIVEALESAAAMMLIFSNSANGSNEIKKELALASEFGLWVLPVRIENVEPKKGFKYELATRQYYDLFVNRESGMKSIIDTRYEGTATRFERDIRVWCRRQF
jgi:hypothetical protein